MKHALLLPGYLDTPEYQHFRVFTVRLEELGYVVDALDPCELWSSGDVSRYSVTNYINHVKSVINAYNAPDEVVLIGHSLGGLVAIVVGSDPRVSSVIALSAPPDLLASAVKWTHGYRISRRDLPNDPDHYRTFAIPESFVEDALKYSAVRVVDQVRGRLMILIGEDDVVVTPERTMQIVDRARDPHIVRLPMLEHGFRRSAADCVRVMEEIERFLSA